MSSVIFMLSSNIFVFQRYGMILVISLKRRIV